MIPDSSQTCRGAFRNHSGGFPAFFHLSGSVENFSGRNLAIQPNSFYWCQSHQERDTQRLVLSRRTLELRISCLRIIHNQPLSYLLLGFVNHATLDFLIQLFPGFGNLKLSRERCSAMPRLSLETYDKKKV
jgi:hypothetical protein